ncbi:MAG: hypothetical protein HY905_10890 [Deltaproteobacteria bacterium]|nr:hypothetical protein [Deltaproteobacteria bacterium]
MSERSGEPSVESRITEVIGQLTPAQRRELLDFAACLRARPRRRPLRSRPAIDLDRIAGSLRDVLSTSEQFAARKASEKLLEERG